MTETSLVKRENQKCGEQEAMFCCQVRVTSMTMSRPTICASLKAVPEASNRKCKAYLKIELDNAAKNDIYIYQSDGWRLQDRPGNHVV